MAIAQSEIKNATPEVENVPTRATKNDTQKAIFIAKLCIMICSGGFIFGNVLVENDEYETYGES
jgi:hypothetical protein